MSGTDEQADGGQEAGGKGFVPSRRTVLVLDTASDEAERLYVRGGWQRVGTIPDYALMPDGAPCATVVYYKRLN